MRDAAEWTVAEEHLSVPAGGSWLSFNQRFEQQVSNVLFFNGKKNSPVEVVKMHA